MANPSIPAGSMVFASKTSIFAAHDWLYSRKLPQVAWFTGDSPPLGGPAGRHRAPWPQGHGSVTMPDSGRGNLERAASRRDRAEYAWPSAVLAITRKPSHDLRRQLSVRVARVRRSNTANAGTFPESSRRLARPSKEISAWRPSTASIASWRPKAHRPCLLSLKASTLMQMKELQSLEDTVTTFVQAALRTRSAHCFAAILEARKNRLAKRSMPCSPRSNAWARTIPGETLGCGGGDRSAGAVRTEFLSARGHAIIEHALNPDDEMAHRVL